MTKQLPEDKIREEYGDIYVTGTGGYITGDGGYFTIWQETKQEEDAGFPEGITVYVSFIMSGYKTGNGDLDRMEFITVITQVITDTDEYDEYDFESLEGEWYMGEGEMELTGPPKLKFIIDGTEYETYHTIIRDLVLDIITINNK